ncbi:MAG: TIGR03986 family CRISPR-associated RAMP protein [Chloroflexi bacterium]|nr:TIGR03986 family CRISPR-associated RAMP protein [Chloroflexota bacterium]
MAIRHNNPTRPRKDRKTQTQHWARAPYNFVPLPERMVPAREPLPDHDVYIEDGLSCWIECDLETCSPTYVRGMLAQEQYKEHGRKGPDELEIEEKKAHAPFFSIWEDEIEKYGTPLIPGSTLRGMVRALVEIVGHGRMRWVAKEPTFTFRAVAASRDDPLRDPYREVIGAFGRNVCAGYLEKEGDDWYIRPAKTPAEMGWPGRDAYLKVKEREIGSRDIPGYLRFNSANYRPQLHRISFNVSIQSGQRGSHVRINQIGSRDAGFQFQGVLVCSGNMLETGKPGQQSPRRNHALVLESDPKARRLKINKQAIEDYVAGMTPFQKEELKAWGDNPRRMRAGNPVFYVPEGTEVFYFGHNPNFRIPARLHGTKRAATPRDFVPDELLTDSRPDLADAIFGWVEEREDGKAIGPKEQRAGRVFFEDAQFVGASEEGVWYKPDPITPHVHSGPKPTTFQHYLEQDKDDGHNPDLKETLAHYGTPATETQIRGHKLYWFKGATPDIEATTNEREHEKQLTRIVPLKPGVRFKFKIHFENLREEELGALLWVLTLPGEVGVEYRHRLGMGKHFGMGGVKITPRLYLTDRQQRYLGLFQNNVWDEAISTAETDKYIQAFEKFVLDGIGSTRASLHALNRIQEFLTMVEWREGDPKWLDATRYMEIERGLDKINEYKERPVLPTPRGVVRWFVGESLEDTPPRPQERRPEARTVPKGSTQPEAGGLVRGTVDFIEDNGDVYLALEGIPTDKMLGRITADRLGGKQYQEGHTASCLVLEIKEEFGDTIIECEPAGVSEQRGEVKVFGLGKSKAFGFIKPDDGGPDVFVHRKQLRGVDTLEKGQRVVYRIGKGMKGLEAQDVQLEE